jgi:hypothetical protein
MLLMNLGISWGLLGDFGDYLAILRRFQMKWISIWFLQPLQSLEEGFIFSDLSKQSKYLQWLCSECLNGGDPSQRRLGVTPLFFCHLAGFSPGNFPILERGLRPLSNRHEVSSRTPFVRDLPYWEGVKDPFPTNPRKTFYCVISNEVRNLRSLSLFAVNCLRRFLCVVNPILLPVN